MKSNLKAGLDSMITSSEILKNRLYRTGSLVKDKRIHFGFERVEGYVNEASMEALEMGACIYFCENSSTPLSGFVFETDDVKRWEGVVPFIEELFLFLTDRTISIQLKKRRGNRQVILVDPVSDGRDTMLFSGGSDSFCGALWAIRNGRDIALAHTMTSPAMLGKADHLHKKHLASSDIPLYNISSLFVNGSLNRFYPQARSALFTFNSVPIIERFQSSTLWIPENGPLMINPPISNMAISTRSTRPEAMKLLSKILTNYLGLEIVVDSPFKNLTKAEMVAQSSAGDSIRDTYSCFNYRWGRYKGMCGRCYGCNTTRFSLYALGIDDRRYHEDYCPFKEVLLPTIRERRNAVFLFSDFIDTCCKMALQSGIEDTTSNWMKKAQSVLGTEVDVQDLMKRFALDMLLGMDRYYSMNEINQQNTLLGKRLEELLTPSLKRLIHDRRDSLKA